MELTEQVKLKIDTENKSLLSLVAEPIQTEKEMASANDILTIASKAEKGLEVERKKYVDPLNKQVKEINAFFKKYTEPLKKLKDSLKQQIIDYQQKKLEEENKDAIELAKALGQEPSQITQEGVKMEGIAGNTSTRMQWIFEVENPKQVPAEYLIVDEKKIREAVRDGVREIAGVKIYQKPVLFVS